MSTTLFRAAKLYLSFFSILIPKNQYFAEEISIFPRGNNMTKKNTFLPHTPAADLAFFQGGASSTSRVAASWFFFAILNPRKWCFPGIYAHITYPRAAQRRAEFFLLFWTPVSDVFLASMHISHIHEPRSGEPIFFCVFWTPVSDVFLATGTLGSIKNCIMSVSALITL